MEQTLQEKLELLQGVVENTPLPVGVYLGEELRIVLANEAMIRTWGKGTEVQGRRYSELLPELASQDVIDQALGVLRTGNPFHAHNRKLDLVIDGTWKTHYFNYSFIPLRNSSGQVYAIMNTGTDVTDLVLARQNVEEAEEKLRLAVSAAGLGTYVTNLATGEVLTSEGFDAIWGTGSGKTRADIIGKIHPEDLPVREQAHQEAAISGKLSYEVRLPKGGSFRWVRVNGKILKDQDGNPASLMGVVQDITEQKEFSEELKKLVAERTADLRRSNEDLLQFANIVSHDLKEPVRKISVFSSMLREDLGDKLEAKNAVYFDKVQRSTQRMSSIINGVLNYSTLNKSSQEVQPIDLNAVIDGIKTDLELIIHEKQAILVKDDFPEIQGAPILVHQLFYNLIHNSLKFSRPDNPPRVTISCLRVVHQGTEHIRVAIKDNGIGFEPEYAQKIFNAFERLHSKDQFEGTGLGLALCKKIAERHHGSIEALGKKDDGAEFIIMLPIRQATDTI